MKKHYIITRYNLGIYKYATKISDSWMESRIKMFDTFCIPSMLSQTYKNFIWILLIDSKTPMDFVFRITKRLTPYPNANIGIRYYPVFVSGPSDFTFKESCGCSLWKEQLLEILKNDNCDIAIQTRLDNDDCLAPNYVEIVQNHVASNFYPQIIDFPNGVMYNTITGERVAHRIEKGVTPYFTFIEKVSPDMKTVYHMDHYRMGLMCKQIVQIPDPGWQMNIHDSNISNHKYFAEHTK